jgi:regulator of sigma E protease
LDNFDASQRKDGMTPSQPEQDREASPGPGTETIGAWVQKHSVTLVVLVVLVGGLIYKFQLSALALGVMLFGLGLVIFIHELGHFLVAKWCDVHVETFSIGFGPALPGCKFRRGETTYMIALIPLGGYVKMVGEGDGSEEDENDPRSFKNKTVWQRMAIISAGVTMNVLLGCLCFIYVYMTHGVERQSATVGMVDAGGPAWIKGLRSGAVIDQIGDATHPHFDDLQGEVLTTLWRTRLPLTYSVPGQPPVQTEIVPRLEEDDNRPMIGMRPLPAAELFPRSIGKRHEGPVLYTSAAAEAEPPFEFGDVIVGTTDPDHPEEIKPLPDDPRHLEKPRPDYFQLLRRCQRLVGKPMVFQVRRKEPDGSTKLVDIRVPPAYRYTFGLRMRMGKVAAVRDGSPAEKAGLQPGDIIKHVKAAAGGRVLLEVAEDKDNLDPERLPFELEQALRNQPGARVTLTVLRPNSAKHEEKGTVELTLDWDNSHEFDEAVPLGWSSPLAIDGLGLAYRVETTVEGVQPGSPAMHGRYAENGEEVSLQKDDVIEAIQFRKAGRQKSDVEWGFWKTLKPDQWAHVMWELQVADFKEVQVRVRRGSAPLKAPILLTAQPDPTWPVADRGFGLMLMPDFHLEKADNLGEALSLGVAWTFRSVKQVYLHLRGFLLLRLSHKLLSGPLNIAMTAYDIASEDLNAFILFLGMISINLAVINFLPIPVLDGGHMVFLIYEKIRRKPASEWVLRAATVAGVVFVLSLMLFVIGQDVVRVFFGAR